MSDHVLLCDIAIGAEVELALTRPGSRPPEATPYSCPDRASFDEALLDFLAQNGQPGLMGVAISSRGWERKGMLQLPQEGMSIVRDDIRALLGVQRINLVNNFVARALAIPRLNSHEVEKICGDEPIDEQVIAVLGPHHGLGLAALAPDGAGSWTAIPCEGGHSDLPVTTDREWQVRQVFARRHGHVAREYAISLEGLVHVWAALSELDGDEVVRKSPEEIVALASIGDSRALEAVQLSMGWLAAMASDVGLILGARGGIYLTGDLMDLIGDLFDADAFCQRYTAKGRLSGYVAEIPVYKTLANQLEIIGLATLFD
ncbi:glucokinase family protein [Asticcacaulis biprosthecium C19]|uniref:Glucokinase family protein n=1 Tax=Asticcacaulis biprosthecium C19 TaxID=715226 RepID=F4QIQ4_9CAUL|nr:glucokinase [Asticcacaulis biprosthecium]EGF91813.1 glucokinase family protein [Asticcacaulis biprosthecium C19]